MIRWVELVNIKAENGWIYESMGEWEMISKKITWFSKFKLFISIIKFFLRVNFMKKYENLFISKSGKNQKFFKMVEIIDYKKLNSFQKWKSVVLDGLDGGWMDGWMSGWTDGWMDGCKSHFKDCLQQSKNLVERWKSHFKDCFCLQQ